MEAFKSKPAFSAFENLSIQIKAFAASAVQVICLIVLGAIAYLTLDKSQQGLHSLSTTILPKQQAFTAVKDAIVAVQMKTFRYVSWASNGVDATLLKSLSGEVDQELRAINAEIAALANRVDVSAAQKSELQALVSKWKSLEAAAKDTIEVGSTDASMATMMLGQADEKFMALAADFQKISSSVVAQTNAISTELTADAQHKKALLTIGAAIGVLLSLLISIVVTSSIVRPIRSVTHAMRRLSSGDTDVAVGYHGRRDEIGQMVEAIAVFRNNALEMRAMEHENLEAEKRNLKQIGEARARLTEAIEAISDGFSLYDADDRLVVFNSKYKTLFAADANSIEVGRPFEAIIRAASLRDMVEDAAENYEAWVARRIAQHRSASSTHIQHRNDGRYIQINERKTAEGGVVATYADITELKANEVELARLVRGLQDARRGLPSRSNSRPPRARSCG
jgi:nitrogen fixation/metabolism regulation signal transduction histidine kinase